MEAFNQVVDLLKWLISAIGMGLVVWGGVDIGRGSGETGTGEDKRNGWMKVAGGAATIVLAQIFASNITPPSF